MAMNQTKPKGIGGQFLYLGKYVDKAHFRAFVYNSKGEKLANSYEEFESLISSGLWFVSKEELQKKLESDQKLSLNESRPKSHPEFEHHSIPIKHRK